MAIIVVLSYAAQVEMAYQERSDELSILKYEGRLARRAYMDRHIR